MPSKSLVISCLVMAGFALAFASAQEMPISLENKCAEPVLQIHPKAGPQPEKIQPMEVTPADTEKKYDVIVIGAGVSGLEAAKHLQSKNLCVIVLEARDRIGGRVWTNNTGVGSFDLGASWIHGLGNMSKTGGSNPIYLMANKSGIQTTPTNYIAAAIYDSHGRKYTDDQYNNNDYNYIDSNFTSFLTNENSSKVKNMDDVISAYKNYMENNKNYSDNMMNYYVDWWYVFDNLSSNLTDLSAKLLFNGTNDLFYYAGDSERESIYTNGGYDQIVNLLADGLDVKHAVVKKIKYDGNDVSVVTDNNETFHATYAVSTLPLGVLKNNKDIFEPQLNGTKATAIDHLDMGVMDKVYFVFDNIGDPTTLPFWNKDHDADWINRLPDNNTDTKWLWFFNLYKYTGKPVLLGFNVGQAARDLEENSTEQIINSGLKILGSMYNTTIPSPDYSNSMVTRWAGDPFARGSYSYLDVNASLTDYDYLAEPIDNKLFFAGEATEKNYSATVHGAYLSGYRAAEKILELENKGSPPYKQLTDVGFQDIICSKDLVLMSNTMNDMPVCIYNNDVAKLENRGFVLLNPTQ